MEMAALNYKTRRDRYVYLAHLASAAMKYREIVKYFKMVVDLNASVESQIARPLATDERALLEKGFKLCIKDLFGKRGSLAIDRKREIEKELLEVCNEMLEIINNHFLPSTNLSLESLVYRKLKADVSILRADIVQNKNEKMQAIGWALDAYQFVNESAAADFPGNHYASLAVVAHLANFVGYAKLLECPPPDKITEIANLKRMAEKCIVDLQLKSMTLDEMVNIETLTCMYKGITSDTLAHFVDHFKDWLDQTPSVIDNSSDVEVIIN